MIRFSIVFIVFSLANTGNFVQAQESLVKGYYMYFHPSGEKIVFSSNHQSQRGFPFNIFMINIDGTGLEQITFDEQFDSFPMFSPDGKKIVFSSNRNNGGDRSTNVFVADWID